MPRLIALLVLAFSLAGAAPARAQLGGLPLPTLPDVGGVLEDVPTAQDIGDARLLRDARRLRIRDLLRTRPRELEPDPNGQPIVRSQILAYGMSATALTQAQAQGFDIVRSDDLEELGRVTVLRAPRGMQTRRALRRLREFDPGGVYDFDHLHLESGAPLTAIIAAQAGAVGAGPRIGLIDTGVDAAAAPVGQRAFASAAPAAGAHGTTIAALIAAAAPGARLYVADIYGGAPAGGASSALARALGWLAEEGVPVINVSLVGPRNRVVEAVVARAVARGHLIVAAVGNDGPAAAPLFPAAYDGVVGVTGVDGRGRVLIEAGRGPQVDFAALGIVSAHARGTSYAAPIVSAMLALRAPVVSSNTARSAEMALRGEARDLGAAGRDDVYGYGLVEAPNARLATR